MKIEVGNWKFETPAKLLIAAITLVVLAALYFATANFQSLSFNFDFTLTARNVLPEAQNLNPQVSP
jgi:hypothetical protein